ncbi:Acyltransferase, partial [Oryctes borbonicus]
IFQVFRTTFSNTLHWAICVPSTCSPKEVSIFFNSLFNTLFPGNTVNVSVSGLDCQSEQVLELSSGEIAYGTILSIYLFWVVLATIYHLVSLYYKEKSSIYTLESPSKNGSVLHKIIIAFSVARNVSKVLQVKRKTEDDLGCVSGLKFLFMALIVPGHTLLFAISGPIMNSEFYEQARTQVQNAIFFNNPLLVDTFLFLGGFLLCRILIQELDKRKGKVNLLIIYIGRYIRLTPSYIVVIGLYCTFLYRLGNGPLWNSLMSKEKERCLNSWWANVLYINNYVNTDHVCMFQSWFLAVDTHMFIISAVIVLFLWKFKNFGKICLAILTLLTLAAHAIETYVKKADPTFMFYPAEVVDLNSNPYFTNIYIKTHIRASSYCIGVVYGYIVYKLHNSSCKIPRYVKWCGWLLGILTGVASMFSISIFYEPGHQYDLIESTVYSTFSSAAWCIFIGWILTMCLTGNGGLINRFLSWKVFVPLSRLTYCAYLVNGIIELHSRGSLRNPLYMSVYSLAKLAVGHLIFTFVAGFILCVLFESPIHSLEKILMSSNRRRNELSVNSTNNNQSPGNI